MNSDAAGSRRVRRLNVGLIGLLIGLYAAAIVFIIGRGKAVDFSLYYLAAYGFAQGEDVYALGGQRQPADDLVWSRLAQEVGVGAYAPPYRYPPLTAALVWPLTLLSPRVATAIWLTASAFALILSAWFLGRASAARLGVPLAFALLALFVPALLTLYAGQVNAFVLLSLSWALYAATRNRLELAGAAVAVGAMLKLVPLAHLAYFGWRSQWRPVAVGMAVIVACMVVSLPLVGWHGLVSYAQNFMALSGGMHVSDAPGNQALSGLFARLLIGGYSPWHFADAARLAVWLTRASSLAFVVATAMLCRPVGALAGTFTLEFALITTTVTLIPPYVWYHQLVLLLLPLFILVDHALSHPRGRWMLPVLALAYIGIDIFGVAWRWLPAPYLASLPVDVTILAWALLARLLIIKRRETGLLVDPAAKG